MVRHARLVSGAAALLGVLLVAVGIVYLTVACENLPGILGPHPGDTAPRTPLGLVVLVVGLAGLALAALVALRRD